jgi:hypothetical protein
MPILVRKPLANFSLDKCVPVGIDGGAINGALGGGRGHKVKAIIQAFRPLFNPYVSMLYFAASRALPLVVSPFSLLRFARVKTTAGF